jgi:glycosyltransferase involved in cell wall biosynthesis
VPLVLTVSRIAPQKDLDTLVAAARALTEPATWVVVGGGDAQLRRRLEAEVSGIPVVFVGERGDVEAWLRAATVLVLTSRWEARALVVQEAMAAGVPVVVPEVGGLPELVGDAGILVSRGDPTATAAAVDELLRDPSRRASLAAAGRCRARTWATPEDEARQWVVRYQSLTGS